MYYMHAVPVETRRGCQITSDHLGLQYQRVVSHYHVDAGNRT